MAPFLSPARRCALRRIGLHAALGALTVLSVLTAASPAFAQAWPDKPLRIMVGANAGGGTDILARLLADKMGPALKQSIVVENRPGASNTIAAGSVVSRTAGRAALFSGGAGRKT